MNNITDNFPALSKIVNGRRVCYLDSAASAQKPQVVIDAMTRVMQEHYSNVHRGLHAFASQTSTAFEASRKTIARFIHAESEKEIVFTRNATEAINLVAASWGGEFLQAGDEIVLTELEHHANIVPWYFLKKKKGVVLKVVPILENGALDMAVFDRLLTTKTKLVAFTHMSNALGTITPAAEIIAKAKAVGAKTLVDGAQGIAHLDVDVQKLGCDFYVFSGHKLYGPTGVGVLYGRYDVLKDMPPYQGGGEMIERVTFDEVTYKDPPYRFEAGTPAIIEVIGLGAAVAYYESLAPSPQPSPTASAGEREIHVHEKTLLDVAEKKLATVQGVKMFSRAPERAAILAFTIDKAHPHDVATILDQMGIAVRAGHHCAQPLMKALGVSATVRASFAAYNTLEDVERLAEGVEKVRSIFR